MEITKEPASRRLEGKAGLPASRRLASASRGGIVYRFYIKDSGSALYQLLNHRTGHLFGHVNYYFLEWFDKLTIITLTGNDMRLRHLKLKSFAPHIFQKNGKMQLPSTINSYKFTEREIYLKSNIYF